MSIKDRKISLLQSLRTGIASMIITLPSYSYVAILATTTWQLYNKRSRTSLRAYSYYQLEAYKKNKTNFVIEKAKPKQLSDLWDV